MWKLLSKLKPWSLFKWAASAGGISTVGHAAYTAHKVLNKVDEKIDGTPAGENPLSGKPAAEPGVWNSIKEAFKDIPFGPGSVVGTAAMAALAFYLKDPLIGTGLIAAGVLGGQSLLNMIIPPAATNSGLTPKVTLDDSFVKRGEVAGLSNEVKPTIQSLLDSGKLVIPETGAATATQDAVTTLNSLNDKLPLLKRMTGASFETGK